MQELSGHLAQTLRSLRMQRGWSLAQAAENTGVSKAMLGQIERGESSPTVATLWKIATGFNVAFSAFLEISPLQQQATLHRYGDAPVFNQYNADMRVVPLFPFDRQLGFDMFVIDLAPGALSESSAHEAGVIEHVIVISGELELAVDGQWHHLASGEAMRFQADRPHAYRNNSQQTVRIHDLIHYPKF
ncbi:HTH-type transcriptional regulator PuuR [Serratia quinivorans]|uniref:helix-turn-helix domain-containing protein n=1 Tax=Serratia quinivorans TaxID=137545 RepID=UPI00217C7784|nr:XRE family transcriptional regulator [Serratia quinivorans]CAI1501011.1 HTH-type transcriptional regulator PuuR [Serratia quinivorans]